MSQITVPFEKGTIDHPIKLNIKDKAGDIKKIKVFAVVGNVVSLLNSFKPSAKGCSKPIKPM